MKEKHAPAKTEQPEELTDEQRRENNRRIFIEEGREKLVRFIRRNVGVIDTGVELEGHTTEELADLMSRAMEDM